MGPRPYFVVDGEGGHLHGHGHDVDSAVDQARLKLLVQVHELLLPTRIHGSQGPLSCSGSHTLCGFLLLRASDLPGLVPLPGLPGQPPGSPADVRRVILLLLSDAGTSPPPRQHLLLGAPGLGLTVQVDEAQEVHKELEHDGEDGVQVEDVRQGPFSGEGLEGLQQQGRWGSQDLAHSGPPSPLSRQ